MTKSIPPRNLTLPNSLAAFVAAILLILPPGLVGQELSAHHTDLPQHPLTLQDCIAIALGESPKLEASRFDLLAATAQIRATQALTWPNLTGSASAEALSGQQTGAFSVINATGSNIVTQTGEVGILSARLTYPVFKDGSFFGLNTPPAVAASRAQKEAVAWTSHLTREEVIYRVTDAFITTVSAQNRADSIARRVGLLEKSVGIMREQQKQGLTLPIDLTLTEEELNGARSLSKIVHDQVVAGKKELAVALGLPSPASLRLSSALPEVPEPPSPEDLLNGPVRNHPSMQVQRATIEKALQEYRLERFRLFPSVSLDGRAIYAHSIDDLDSKGAHIFTGAIAVSVPIFDFGAQSATARAKRMTYLAEQARLGSVADDVIYEIVRIYQEIYAIGQSMLTTQTEISRADREARVATAQQEQGLAGPLIANEAELHLVEKRDELTSLQIRRLLLYAALQRATGGAWKWLP